MRDRGVREQGQAGDVAVLAELRDLLVRQAADIGAQREAVRLGDD